MLQPIISICISTFKRANYLDWQLNNFMCLGEKVSQWEFVISSNGILDNTRNIIEKYQKNLNILFHEFPINFGPEVNFRKTIQLANSNIVALLADDDFLDVDAVNQYLKLFEDSPNLAAIYAPWKYLNLIDQSVEGQFYYQNDDVIIRQKDYFSATEHILDHSIFPEIWISRKEVVKNWLAQNDVAFHFLIWFTQTIKSGDIILLKNPFYYSITRHHADSGPRNQLGTVGVKNSWDSYKGGFEILITLSKRQRHLPQVSLDHYRAQIEEIIRVRMRIAFEAKLRAGEFLESYILFLRINNELNDFEYGISLNDILGLAALEDIVQNSDSKNKPFYLDVDIDSNVRILANKFLPEKFLLINKNNNTIYKISPSKEFYSYEDAVKKLSFFD